MSEHIDDSVPWQENVSNHQKTSTSAQTINDHEHHPTQTADITKLFGHAMKMSRDRSLEERSIKEESYQSDICRFRAVTVSPLFEKYQLNIFKKVVWQSAVPSVPMAPPMHGTLPYHFFEHFPF